MGANGEYHRLTVRLPADLWERLNDEADRLDVSVNFLVVRAVTRYLPTLVLSGDSVDG